MKGIKGQLSSLSITDLMQWIEMNKKSGVLFVSLGEQSKCFCFKSGKLILASCKTKGEKFSDFLIKEGHVSYEAIMEAIEMGRASGTSFVTYMVESKILPKEFLSAMLRILAERHIIDILSWPDGFFEFAEDLPAIIADSPVHINAGFIVFESVRKYDEMHKNKSAH